VRTREIGIRKVFGASLADILFAISALPEQFSLHFFSSSNIVVHYGNVVAARLCVRIQISLWTIAARVLLLLR